MNCWISSPEFLLILLPATATCHSCATSCIYNWLLMLRSIWKEEDMLAPCDYLGLYECNKMHCISPATKTTVWKWDLLSEIDLFFYYQCSFHVRCTDNPFLTCSTSEVPILLSYCLFMPIKCQLRQFGSDLQRLSSICNLYWFQLDS